MTFRMDRRAALATALTVAGAGTAAAAGKVAADKGMAGTAVGLDPNATHDQSDKLQAAIDQAAARRVPLVLPAGRYLVGNITLRPGTRIVAAGAGTILAYNGRGSFVSASDAADVRIEGLVLDGGFLALGTGARAALLTLTGCARTVLVDVRCMNSAGHGLRLERVGGRIEACEIAMVKGAGIFSIDGTGLAIADSTIDGCQDNGILVWRSTHGDDTTRVTGNTVSHVAAQSGGSGQNGNGINIYRAAGVMVSANRITDCAYSAVRANEASNVQMIGNHVARMGEVALYVEAADEQPGAAGFEGAVIADNVVDTAASGIVVTNFNNGGRLATLQGNVIRNLFRREQEPQDKRGEGIAVEADAVVANNVIENAPTAGLMIGWGRHMRNVVATGNLIRKARIGVAVSGVAGAGACVLANNLITGATDGAIRAMDHARPVGADLVRGDKAPPHIQLAGNIATA